MNKITWNYLYFMAARQPQDRKGRERWAAAVAAFLDFDAMCGSEE